MIILTEIMIEERDRFDEFQGKNQRAKITSGEVGRISGEFWMGSMKIKAH